MPDTLLPRPVDLDRVEDAVDALGYQFLAADDRLLLPWPNHRISMYFGHESGVHLTMLARMRMSLDLSMINDVAHALNRWNTERIAPAAMLHVGDLGEIEIRFRSSLSVDEGVSTDQLLQFIQLTINTVEMAVDTVMELFSELDITGLFVAASINSPSKNRCVSMVRWPVAICVPATSSATGTTS